jgi:type I restriction enzyme R subunit
LLERLLGKDYEVITADDRLDKLAEDFVEHGSTRWQTGKSMLVCIDKITCARMFQRIEPRWKVKLAGIQSQIPGLEAELAAVADPDARERLASQIESLRRQVQWMEGTIIEIVISEAQNEPRDFQKWGFDIIPHRVVMKTGFETPDGKRVTVEDAFKDPQHPFRIAIVCAMWLTGFDVECLATLYIDKPMKAHSLMQAIARANRVFPGKACGVIVDYNGMLKSLREALAQYALGDEDDGAGGGGIVAPIGDLVASLLQAIEAAEKHLLGSASMRPGFTARPDLTASKPSATRWTCSTHRMRRSGASKSWRGRYSRDSRRFRWSRALWLMPRATTTSRLSTKSCKTGATRLT